MKYTRLVESLTLFLLLMLCACTVNKQTVDKSSVDKAFVLTDSDSRMIGEVEPVTIIMAKMTLPARIDTGATTSSIDAKDIRRFERDGEKWVRFTLEERKSGKTFTMESKLTRTVEIRRHGNEPQERPVVKFGIALGPVEREFEFSLTDRSAYEYQVLIGRNVLEGEFVVDVSKKNTTSSFSEK